MKKNFVKGLSLLSFSTLIVLLHVVFASAVNKPVFANETVAVAKAVNCLPTDEKAANSSNATAQLYDTLQLNQLGLSQQAFEYAMKGFNNLVQKGSINNQTIISIADFSLPSSRKRFYVIDLVHKKVLYTTYVAHGINSGREYARSFSNIAESNQSSLGFYVTKSTYNGGNGYSLKLQGLESGFNSNAEERAIVIHGAAYVTENLVRQQGYIGRSQGCPALPEKMSKPIIDKIKNGTCLFIYSPDKNYLKRSVVLKA